MNGSVFVGIDKPAAGACNIVGQELNHRFTDNANRQQAESYLVEGDVGYPIHGGHSLRLAWQMMWQRKEAEK